MDWRCYIIDFISTICYFVIAPLSIIWILLEFQKLIKKSNPNTRNVKNAVQEINLNDVAFEDSDKIATVTTNFDGLNFIKCPTFDDDEATIENIEKKSPIKSITESEINDHNEDAIQPHGKEPEPTYKIPQRRQTQNSSKISLNSPIQNDEIKQEMKQILRSIDEVILQLEEAEKTAENSRSQFMQEYRRKCEEIENLFQNCETPIKP